MVKILLGFDFGMKRIGVAIGQTITRTARPLQVIPAKQGQPSLQTLRKLMEQWQPQALVVGIPRNMDGTEQPISHSARQFAQMLRDQFQLPVYETDERLTTKDARERLFKEGGYKALQHGQVDCVAAQLILQTWLADYQEKN
jgi:putative Holliday junction resolvase